MERNLLDRSTKQIVLITAYRALLGSLVALTVALTPWYVGLPLAGFYVGVLISSIMSMRGGECQYCGARDGAPVKRDGVTVNRTGFTWVCSRHWDVYLDEKL